MELIGSYTVDGSMPPSPSTDANLATM